jgi:uncharacterized DUF497 family protein
VYYDFRWIDWNLSKIEKHGLTPGDVEYVVNRAQKPYPKPMSNEKWLVVGAMRNDRMIQAIYLIEPQQNLFVIHARPLTRAERRRHRRN